MYSLTEVLALLAITIYCFAPLPPETDLRQLKPGQIARLVFWPFIIAFILLLRTENVEARTTSPPCYFLPL